MDLQRLIQSNGQKTEPSVVVQASPIARDIVQFQQNKQQVDNYDEQVNRLLAESVERSSATTPKQTVFNDTNYVPARQVNTISMAVPQQPAASHLTAAPQQEYVTVVQETKPSCWPFKQGSINCRNHKKAIKRAHSQNCYDSAHSHTEACRRAALYNPVQ